MRKIFSLIAILIATVTANAQYVTYNHDETKMNQVMVMETGAGKLRPAAFYEVIHGKYTQTAAQQNKLRYRTEVGASGYTQVGMANQIDTTLAKRASIESLNMTDRKVDLAWEAEGQKIEAKMKDFRDNIGRILLAGGTPSDNTRWDEYYRLFQTAITATREAYMPNAERKKEYLRIYSDLTRENETLVHFIVAVNNRKNIEDALNSHMTRVNNNAEIAAESKNRWTSVKNRITE